MEFSHVMYRFEKCKAMSRSGFVLLMLRGAVLSHKHFCLGTRLHLKVCE
jgi:hypothetical protein